MEVYALDAEFQLVTVGIPYDNLQWSRRYYEPGDFSMQLPLSAWDASWAYIGTTDRPELGIVQKLESDSAMQDTMLVSGFFAEAMLNDKACYPRYVGDASTTEAAVRAIFAKYKDDLPIALGPANSPLLGNRTQSDFSDDELGRKLYSILESREMSYRVTYDFVANRLEFGVWKGLDRTQSQAENAYMVFSSEFGNLGGRSIDFDNSDYKNYAIIPCDGRESDNVEQRTLYVDFSGGGYKREIVVDMRASHPEEGQTDEEFEDAVRQEVTEVLLSYAKVEDIDINPVGDSEYMTAYDLGDKCDMVLSDVGLAMESRIIEVNEVFKADGHEVTVGLGNKRISNVRRAVNAL